MKIATFTAQWNMQAERGEVLLRLEDGQALPRLDVDAAGFSALTSLLLSGNGSRSVQLVKGENGEVWLSTSGVLP